MAKSLKHCPVGLNPEAWVLEPSAWGFTVDVWGVDFDVEDFDAGLQSFPVSARGLPVDGFSFTVDREAEGPPPEEIGAASWDFDPDQWGFASGWADTTH
jgi:hypothetical protein